MSEALFLTFQSQLSVVMETVLKSAMFEITRLVEDSFLEEVGHRKQEVEVLRRRLQLSESKLRQKEYEQGRKIHCLDCGCCRKGASSNKDIQSVETIHGPILRDQSTNEPPSTQPKIHTASHPHSIDKHEVHRQSVKDITTPNSNIQIPQDVLQRLLGNAPVQSESTSEDKPRVRDKSEHDCTLDKDMSSNHSRLLHSPLAQEALEPSSPKKVKSETEPKLLPVKEEEEMVPVWEGVNRDDVCHEEMADPSHGELSGSCDQEEIQVDSFPDLNSLDMPDATSFFTPYSVNTLVHQGIRAQHSQLSTTDLGLSSIPVSSNLFVQQENGQNFTRADVSESSAFYSHSVVCPGEKIISRAQYPRHFSQDKRRMPAEQIHAERSHHCTHCGRTFVRACDLRAHMLIHKGKKPLNCPQCDQTFAYNFELRVHQQHHSGERPHICPHCGKAFARLSNYRQHQNIHTREKLFSCTQCGMRFNRATNLRVHIRRHSHAGKTYNCPQCGKSFLGPRQMKTHLLKIHGRGGK
ncbi:zinc finger protein 544 isoform X2 [Triplophysa dalaica]|uniref:zinc finger protein 544 isoform X2 n=1 Tax=Triplophysa dalaica TaxID=1582913 RepID=UPI0024DF3254|nr:zinc finger protein 544 isoform X2 [Triplophysa dalaica]